VRALILPLTATALVTSAAHAALTFDEASLGDFSNDRLSPSQAELGQGLNQIVGSFGLSPIPDSHDLDYLTIRIPEGMLLESFRVHAASVGGAFAFVAMQAGPTVTIPADWTSIDTPLLGWAHFGTASIGMDLLPDMGSSPGSIGFTGPLPTGEYTLWIMELDTSEQHHYAFNLQVSLIPSPAALPVMGVPWLLTFRRRPA
jgi:hypothetical protein